MIIPELLAPAGGPEALKAAVWAGADAVYLGGQQFSARATAVNFSLSELESAITFAHRAKVKIFVTVNTLIKENELAPAVRYLGQLHNMGADGVILQDLGLASLSKTLFPTLERHASTQMTTTSVFGALALKSYGFSRVVLARELSFSQIKEISAKNLLQTEIFLHGALCVAYSGQCLLSSLIGGRSGNRGQCAQPCRLPYTNSGNGRRGFLLSPRDLWLIDHIGELLQLQCQAWKIEGRLKRPQYIAEVVSTYRRALDTALANPKEYHANPNDKKKLLSTFNRQFTNGYIYGKPGAEFYSGDRPDNRGEIVGWVQATLANTVAVHLIEPLHKGDVIDFGQSEASLTLEKDFFAKQEITMTVPAEGRNIHAGSSVHRTLGFQRNKWLKDQYQSFQPPKRTLDWQVFGREGEPLVVTAISDEHLVTVESPSLLTAGVNVALTAEAIKKQLEKLGDTQFVAKGFEIDISPQLYLALASVNNCRRQATEKLELLLDRRATSTEIEIERIASSRQQMPPTLGIVVNTIKEALAAERAGADWLVFGKEWLENSIEVYFGNYLEVREQVSIPLILRLPRIMHTDEEGIWEGYLNKSVAVLAPSIAAIALAKKLGCFIHGDSGLNIMNSKSSEALDAVASLTASLELNKAEIKQIAQVVAMPFEVVVHGAALLMVHENCLIGGSTTTKCLKCIKNTYLTDRLGESFPIFTDYRCRSYIQNSHVLSLLEEIPLLLAWGVSRLRVEAAGSGAEVVSKLTAHYKKGMNQAAYSSELPKLREEISTIVGRMTKGHWNRGV
ncbi:MAG: DUF3656 domain-containing protein [bacterium]|nr:DUF3656 domain-containing protein [bacterium]